MTISFDEYQQKSSETAVYPTTFEDVPHEFAGILYCAMGLAGEAGEFLDKVKKIFRNNNGQISDSQREELIKELSDTMWYQAQLAKNLGITLGEVAEINLKKLADRKNRGVLKGAGDNR